MPTLRALPTDVCQDCARLPKPRRDAIDQEHEVLVHLTQSRISEQNLARLRTLAATAAPSVAESAGVVLAGAEITPFKKGRLRVLARERGELLAAAVFNPCVRTSATP